MKILYVSDNNINTKGGSQSSIMLSVSLVSKLNYELGIIQPSNKNVENTIQNNIKIYEYKPLNSVGFINYIYIFTYKLLKIRKFITLFQPDIIHVQNPTSILILTLLKKYRLIKNNIKLIYTDRGFYNVYSKKYKKFIKNNFECIDKIITTTKINEKLWKENTGFKNIYTINNVLNEEWFVFNKNEENLLKNRYNVNNSINIGFCGRYDKIKRWDTVYQICKKLKEYEKFHFIFALISDKQEDNELIKFVDNIKKLLGNKVTILFDLNKQKMMEFYYILDFFVLTSENESFGKTLIEAMTKNNIVLGTNSGGVPDVINNSDYLFDVADYEKACNIIFECLSNKDINIEKEKFMKYAIQNFTPDKLLEELKKLYLSV